MRINGCGRAQFFYGAFGVGSKMYVLANSGALNTIVLAVYASFGKLVIL